VHRLQVIAGSPELYPELVRLGAVPSILALLSHENGDIAASVLELLRELTDADATEDSVRTSAQNFAPLQWAAGCVQEVQVSVHAEDGKELVNPSSEISC
jgi:beta-catenin-like protein 1